MREPRHLTILWTSTACYTDNFTFLRVLLLTCRITFTDRTGYRSLYSVWLQAGRPKGRSSSPDSVKNFLFSTSSRPALGSTQPRIQWEPGALSPGIKRPGRKTDHSTPTSAEVRKMWICTSTPPYVFMV
jgi:hypothetical protein